ncbi:type III secretion system export apparatus subunit SctT [Ideonella sp. YS5]|uniref:type III secretion system export apparatus subunit SctT n=1 Tax=Ideonella sp. YS5 TaxID=3453714 RepID=UPI003EEF392A
MITPDVQNGLALLQQGAEFKGLLGVLALCTVRVYAALLVLPATSDQILHGQIRNALALSFGLFIAWGQPPDLLTHFSVIQIVTLSLKEGMIGMLIGFAVSSVFWMAEGVGMLIDNQAGYNNVQQQNPLSGQQSTPVGNLLSQLAIVAFYMLGGMMVFVGLLIDSYEWWPLHGTLPSWPTLLERFLPAQVQSLAETTLKIAGPVIVTLMLIDLGIGLLGKAAEKLEPNSLGQPIKGATAMLMLVMLVSIFFNQARPELSIRPVAKRLEQLAHPVEAASAPSAASGAWQ